MHQVRHGFQELVPRSVLEELVSARELETVLVGSADFDVLDWRRHSVAKGFDPSAPQVPCVNKWVGGRVGWLGGWAGGLCVCVCVYMYTYTHTRERARTHTHTHTHTHIHVFPSVCRSPLSRAAVSLRLFFFWRL